MATQAYELVTLKERITEALNALDLSVSQTYRLVTRVADREGVYDDLSEMSVRNWMDGVHTPTGWWLFIVPMAVNEELARQKRKPMLPNIEPGSIQTLITGPPRGGQAKRRPSKTAKRRSTMHLTEPAPDQARRAA